MSTTSTARPWSRPCRSRRSSAGKRSARPVPAAFGKTPVTASFDLDGRVVIVTGGLGQLGASFARALLAAGPRVAVLDAVEADAPRRTATFGDTPDEVLRLYKADVTSRASLEDVLVRIQADLGVPYGLVNNAA